MALISKAAEFTEITQNRTEIKITYTLFRHKLLNINNGIVA